MTETSDFSSTLIWTAVSGTVHGPYTLKKIAEFLRQGNVKMETLARTQSMDDWQPLSEVLAACDGAALEQLPDAVDVPPAVSLAEAEREFGRVKLKLTMEEPFFGHLLNLPTLFYTKITPTAAVALLKDGSIRLIINPEFFLLQLTFLNS